MSGVLKSVGKVFKKVVKSKIFRIAAIAAAVYFTAGIGLAASGSAFAAGMPGIASAAGALGIDISAGLAVAGEAAGALGAVADVTAGGAFGGAADAAGAAYAGGAAGAAETAGGIASSAMQAGGEDFAAWGADAVADNAPSAVAQGGSSIPSATPAANAPSTGASNVAKLTSAADDSFGNVASTAKSAAKGAAQETGGWEKWIASDGAKNIMAQAAVGAAKAGLGALAQNSAVKSAAEERQKDRDIRANNQRTIDMSNGSFRPSYQNISTNSGIVSPQMQQYGLGR